MRSGRASASSGHWVPGSLAVLVLTALSRSERGYIKSSPAFVREPEGHGCAERFIRTLKEQLLWIKRFDSVEALRQALLAFKDRYNREWLIERHGH